MGFKSVAGDFEATYSYLVGPDEKKSNMERKQFLRGSQEGERLTETSASSLLLCLDPQTPTSNYSYTSALPFQSTAETLPPPRCWNTSPIRPLCTHYYIFRIHSHGLNVSRIHLTPDPKTWRKPLRDSRSEGGRPAPCLKRKALFSAWSPDTSIQSL